MALSNFRRLINLLSSSQAFLIYSLLMLSTHLRNVPAQHTKPHSPHSLLIVRTLSAPIQLSNSTGAFGHRASLIWGDRCMARGFSLRTSDTLHLQFVFAIRADYSLSYIHCRAFIVVRIYRADDLARSFIDTITPLAVKGGGTP